MRFRIGDSVVSACPIYAARHKMQVAGLSRLSAGMRGVIKDIGKSNEGAPFFVVRFEFAGLSYWAKVAETVLKESKMPE